MIFKLYDYYDVEYDAYGERPYKEDSDYVNEPPVDEQTLSEDALIQGTQLQFTSDEDDGTCEYEVTIPGDNQDNDVNRDDALRNCDEHQ